MNWAHVLNDRIVAVWPDSTESAVRTAGDVLGRQTVQVPHGIEVGATLVDGEWVNPAPIEPAPDNSPRMIPSTLFRERFTAMEEAAVITLSKTDPIVQAFYSRLLDPRQLNVDLRNAGVTQGLGYLATLDDPLSTTTPKAKVLTTARIAEILA